MLFSSVQSLSSVRLFATPWTAARHASLSITNSQSLLRLMSIESVMPSNHPLSSPSPPTFNLSQHQGLFRWVSSSHQVAKVLEFQLSVLPINIQGWFPLVLTGLILLSKGLSQESSPAPQFESINSLVLSLFYGPNFTSIHDYWKNYGFDYMLLYQQSDVSVF